MKVKALRAQDFYLMHPASGVGYWDKSLAFFDPALITSREDLLSPSRLRAVFRSQVDVVNVELSSRCNRECIYCPVTHWSRKEQMHMPDSVLERVVTDLAAIGFDRTVSLNLYNEPFVDHEYFLQRLAVLRSRLPSAVLYTNSNGDYIDKNLLHSLSETGLNKLKITIHPPRGKEWSRSRELRSLQRFINRLGAPEILPPETSDEFRLEAFFAVDDLAVIVQSVDWQREGNSRAGTAENVLNVVKDRETPCIKPFREVTVFYDGTVTMCCDAFYDRAYQTNAITRISEQTSLFSAYFNDQLRGIRRNLLEWGPKEGVCRTCAVPDTSAGEPLERRVQRSDLLALYSPC